MIYLIGGSPRCGKTILAKKVARKGKCSLISTDGVLHVVMNTVKKSELFKMFPQRKMQAPKGKFRFDVYSPEALLRAQIIEAKSMWPGTKALIAHLIEREQDYVIEGVHLFPGLVKTLKKTNLWKDIKIVFIIKKDIKKLKDGFLKNKDEYDWMLPATKNDPRRLTKVAEMVQVKSIYIEKEAKKHNFKVYNTENDFKKKLSDAQRFLLN